MRYCGAVAFLVAAGVSTAMADGPAAGTSVTPNGHSAVISSLPDTATATIHVAWPMDWLAESHRNLQVPAVGVEALLSSATSDFDAFEIAERMEDLGAEATLIATPTHVIGRLTADARTFLDAAHLVGGIVADPMIEPIWMDRAKEGVAQTAEAFSTRPAVRGWRTLREAVYGHAGLEAILSGGDPDSARVVTLSDIEKWHQRTFVTDGAIATVAGNLDEPTALVAVDAVLSGLPQAYRPKEDWAQEDRVREDWVRANQAQVGLEITPDYSPRQIVLHDPSARQAMVAIIAPLADASPLEVAMDRLIAAALGQGENSVLFRTVRDEFRASYDFGAWIETVAIHHRALVISASVDKNALPAVLDAMHEAYEDFRRNGPAPSAVDALLYQLDTQFAELGRDPLALSLTLLEDALSGFPVESVTDRRSELAAISSESIGQRLQNVYPASEELITIVVTPDPEVIDGACVVTHPRNASSCD